MTIQSHVRFNNKTITVEFFQAIAEKLPAKYKMELNEHNQVTLAFVVDGIDETHNIRLGDYSWDKSGIKVSVIGSYRYDLRSFSVYMKGNDEENITKLVYALDRYVVRYCKAKKEQEEHTQAVAEYKEQIKRNMAELLGKFPELTVPLDYFPYQLEYKGYKIELTEYSVYSGKFITDLRFGKQYGKEVTLDKAMEIIDMIS